MMLLRLNLQNTAISITRAQISCTNIFCDNIKRNKSTINIGKTHCLSNKLSSRKSAGQSNFNGAFRGITTERLTAPSGWNSFDRSEEMQKYMLKFPDVLRDLRESINKYDKHFTDQLFTKVMEYNVPKGNFTRTLSAMFTHHHFANESQKSEENIRRLHHLCWCVEMVLTSVCLTDDIMDGSLTRRNQKCWYLVEGVEMQAISDALIMENGIYYILKKHFGDTDHFVSLMELFHEAFFVTGLGQALELDMTKKNVSDFNMDVFQTIVDNKTSFFSIYLPIASVMLMLGKKDPEFLQEVLNLSNMVGAYFQINNDFLDCYADPTATGKIGNDIQENKCSWLAVKCMERASSAQKLIMKNCYGQKDPEKVKRVKQLYDDLNLYSVFMEYEKETYSKMVTNVRKGDDTLKDLFSWVFYLYYQTGTKKLQLGK